jgi:hypothetical protein
LRAWELTAHWLLCFRDYEARPGLDTYEAEGIDEGFEEEMTFEEQMEARRRAEEDMEQRDGGRRRKRALPRALEGESTADKFIRRTAT